MLRTVTAEKDAPEERGARVWRRLLRKGVEGVEFFYYGRRGRGGKKTQKRQARAEPSGACGRLRVLSPLAVSDANAISRLPGEKR